jgi:hypothetical protein
MIGVEEPKQTNNNKPRADQLLDTWKMHKGLRSNFESYWQSLHDYYYIEAEDVNTTYYPGTELNASYLYDSTTLEAADVLASGFMNYLTPPTSKWYGLTPKDPKLRSNKTVCTYLEDVRDAVNAALNKSNFYNQIIASYKGSGVYGTSCLIEEEDVQDDVRFNSIAIKNVVLVEDGRGRVIQYFVEFEYTARQAESRWGREALPRALQEELESGSEKANKHLFLLYIANRSVREVQKSDRKNMPIEAVWLDQENRQIVDEGGYNEFPAFCHRFDKRPSIVWGFSPGMKTLPFARILNAVAKTNLRSMMKLTDPPIAVPDNSFMMPLNMNPRATNYYNKKVMDRGAADMFAFGNYGNPQVGMEALTYYTERVKAMMYNDVFLAFDNITKQMNNPEVMERINEKMTMLGPAVGRYISEMLNPVIIRTIGILARRGKLPKPPLEMLMSPEYEIDCISQLAQAQRRSELNSLVSGLTLVAQMAQFSPQVTDKVDPDKVVDEAWAITGAPDRVLRDDSEIQQLRETRGKLAAQQQQMNMAQQGAATVKDGSQVDLNVAKAKAHVGVVPTTRAQ